MTTSSADTRATADRPRETGFPVVGRAQALLRTQLAFPGEIFEVLVESMIMGLDDESLLDTAIHAEAEAFARHRLKGSVGFALRALAVRRDRILPPSAPPERVGELAHRWTYAVFVAGLRRAGHAGDSGAAVRQFDLIVPEIGRQWLNEDPAVSTALADVLASRSRADNPIEAILREAATGSDHRGLRAVGLHGQAATAEVASPAAPGQALPASTTPLRSAGGVHIVKAASSSAQGIEFFEWLREGLATGAIKANARNGFIHRVREGLLLVWPGVFQSFLENGRSAPAAVRSMKRLRQSVFEAGWDLRGAGGVAIHDYAWGDGGQSSGQVSGVVITTPELLIDPPPPLNMSLEWIEMSADPIL